MGAWTLENKGGGTFEHFPKLNRKGVEIIDSPRHLLESERRSLTCAAVPEAIGFRGHLGLQAKLPRKVALITKAVAKSDFA